jgi:hypothetical protein
MNEMQRRRMMGRLSLRGSERGKRKGHTARNNSDRQAAVLLLLAKFCGAVK